LPLPLETRFRLLEDFRSGRTRQLTPILRSALYRLRLENYPDSYREKKQITRENRKPKRVLSTIAGTEYPLDAMEM
jgi:hypothetical protein